MFKTMRVTTMSATNLIKRMISLVLLTMTAVMFSLPALSLESLRGDNPLDKEANQPLKHDVRSKEGGYERSFELQPPLIPHNIDKYRITLKNNGCMNCHSEKAYMKEKATKIADSHFVTRDGETLKTLSSRRYFCTQCHVPQVDSTPLVENTFEGVKK